jgi:hypothetical protein
LIATLNKTIDHIKGTKKMSSEEMFAGFRVAPGGTRVDEVVKLGGEPNDCKVSGRDTGGAMCVFEFTGSSSGPRRRHRDQDEWIYVLDGELMFFEYGMEVVGPPLAGEWKVEDGRIVQI